MGFLKQAGQLDLKTERSGFHERPYFNKYSGEQYRKTAYSNSSLYTHVRAWVYTPVTGYYAPEQMDKHIWTYTSHILSPK